MRYSKEFYEEYLAYLKSDSFKANTDATYEYMLAKDGYDVLGGGDGKLKWLRKHPELSFGKGIARKLTSREVVMIEEGIGKSSMEFFQEEIIENKNGLSNRLFNERNGGDLLKLLEDLIVNG